MQATFTLAALTCSALARLNVLDPNRIRLYYTSLEPNVVLCT